MTITASSDGVQAAGTLIRLEPVGPVVTVEMIRAGETPRMPRLRIVFKELELAKLLASCKQSGHQVELTFEDSDILPMRGYFLIHETAVIGDDLLKFDAICEVIGDEFDLDISGEQIH